MNEGKGKKRIFVIVFLVLTMVFTTGMAVFAAEMSIIENLFASEETGTRTWTQ